MPPLYVRIDAEPPHYLHGIGGAPDDCGPAADGEVVVATTRATPSAMWDPALGMWRAPDPPTLTAAQLLTRIALLGPAPTREQLLAPLGTYAGEPGYVAPAEGTP